MLSVLLALALSSGPDAGVAAQPKAVVLLADSPDVIEKWATLKPGERATFKGLVDKVKINQRIAIGIAVQDWELPRSRLVDLTCDVLITDSTGRDVLERASAAGAKTWDPKTQTALLLKPIGQLQYGTVDPEGVYSVKVTVWDQVRGVSWKAEASFTVSR